MTTRTVQATELKLNICRLQSAGAVVIEYLLDESPVSPLGVELKFTVKLGSHSGEFPIVAEGDLIIGEGWEVTLIFNGTETLDEIPTPWREAWVKFGNKGHTGGVRPTLRFGLDVSPSAVIWQTIAQFA